MNVAHLSRLRLFSLGFLLPGLAGLIVSVMFSTYYLESLPRWPAPEEMRTTPRNIRGIIVYQTVAEDQILNAMEYASIGIFAIGLGLGLVYLKRWGSSEAAAGTDPETVAAPPPACAPDTLLQ